MADLAVDVEIARPRAEVLAWWTGFADEYSATDPREQPHRIKVISRTADRLELLTWWRTPWGGELRIPETIQRKPNGDFDVAVALPLGLEQVDRFTVTQHGPATRVHIEIDIRARGWMGRMMRPAYMHYARRTYPRTFRSAGRLCERDAPHAA